MAPAPRDAAAQVLEAFREALVREHIVTGAGLERALQHGRAAGLDLQDAIVSLGLIDEETAYRLLADAAHIPFADLKTVRPTALARHLVPPSLLHRHEVLPLSVDDKAVRYVTSKPCDLEADRALSMSTGRSTAAMLACRSELRAALADDSLEPSQSAAPRTNETDRDAASARHTVLIVDDDGTTRGLVRLLLERDGYRVLEAVNGRNAVDIAATEKLDLVVMDLLMPELDGYGAIVALRSHVRHTTTPIVVVTSEEGPAVEAQVLELGADDYILKPFEPTVLTSRIKAAFRRQRLAVSCES